VIVSDLVTSVAADHPELAAMIEGDRTITYRKLETTVRRTAAHLHSLGVTPGDRVGLCLKDNANHLIALLAVARAGAIALPLDWRGKPAELRHQTARFLPRLVLVEDGATGETGAVSIALDRSWHAAVAAAADDMDFPNDANADFLISPSSGTTGEPRGALVTHIDYAARYARLQRGFGLPFGLRGLSVTPLVYSAGRNNSLYLLFGGGTVVFYPPLFAPEEYVEQINRNGATFAFVVPTVLRWLLKLPQSKALLFPSMKVFTTGGAFVSAEEKREFVRRVSPRLHVSYSSSSTGQISLLMPDEMETRAESAGRPQHLVEVEMVDDDDRVVPTDVTGRLRCRGPGIGGRFFGEDPPRVEAGQAHPWLYTGELAAFDRDGYIHLRGRVSEIIIRDGINIYPEEIETLLRAQPGVAEAAVVGRPSDEHGEETVAFVVADGPLDAGVLLHACKRQLTRYKVPSEIIFMDALPKTVAGKVMKNDLAASL